MAVDAEVILALKQAVREIGQTEALEQALAAWLNAMSESELRLSDNRRHLESAKHAVRVTEEIQGR